jgi:hypothetical protein
MKMKIEKQSILGIMIIAIIVFFAWRMYEESAFFQLRCIISSVDGEEYCVRDREKSQEAVNLLARVVNKCNHLVSHLKETKAEHPITKRLVKGYNPKSIRETLPTSSHTAYSENKGEKMAFCLSKMKNSNKKLIDLNTLTFVALHEVAHIATISVGHTQEFWQNFKYLLDRAVDLGIYSPVDYKNEPTGYCGMTINDNPYYDM